VLALSAYKDPLTGETLPIAPDDRAALNDPKLEADAPDKAYVPRGGAPQRAAAAPTALAGRSGNGVAEQRTAKELPRSSEP
jgi:cytochrome c oxidase cbb3-type subunit 2